MSFLQIGEVFLGDMLVTIAEPYLVEEKIDVGGCLRRRDAGLEPAEDVERFSELVRVAAQLGRDHSDHGHGDPDVRRLADGGAEEFLRGDADDVEGGVAEFECAGEDFGVAGEAAVPPGVADDGDGIFAFGAVVVVGEGAADESTDAEGGEVGAGDELDIHRLGTVATGDDAVDGVGAAEDGSGAAEDGVIFLQIAIEGIGIEIGVCPVVGDAAIDAVTEHDKLRGLLHGKIAEQDCIEEAEDGGVSADAEGEREQGDGGERGTAEQGAHAVGDILEEAFEPFPTPGEMSLLVNQCGIAEGAQGCEAGFFRR